MCVIIKAVNNNEGVTVSFLKKVRRAEIEKKIRGKDAERTYALLSFTEERE